MTSPTPEEIRQARIDAGLTQTQAADLVHTKLRTWQQWEASDRAMHAGLWELFCIKTAKPAAPVDENRARFEQWAGLNSRQAWRTKDGSAYQDPTVQAKWEGWQARSTDKD